MSFDYFLGANTPDGFVSTFQSLTASAGRLYIIKGGPGCGKSTMMKRIADVCEALGTEVQRIWCSSDPRSLDGVYFPELDTLYVDGTAPHVVEPTCPGAREQIVNLGAYWDEEQLSARRTEIEDTAGAVSACYTRAYGYLRALGELSRIRRQAAEHIANREKLERRGARIIHCRIPAYQKGVHGRVIRVFLNALTPAGPCYRDVLSDYTITELYDPDGIYGIITGPVLQAAQQAGYTVYAACDPLSPHGAPLHLVIPALRYALITTGGIFGAAPSGGRRIRLDLMKRTDLQENDWGKPDQTIVNHLLNRASAMLGQAKAHHDALEDLYRPAVDFQGIDRLTEAHIDRLSRQITHKTHDSQW